MDKTTAQQTLKQLQDSIAAATKQAKELQAIIDKPDVPSVFQGSFVDFDSARSVKRYTIYSDGDIDSTASYCRDRFNSGRLFPTREAAETQVAYEKVRQLARIAMAKDWGNEPVVQNGSTSRYAVIMFEGKVKVQNFSSTILPILFRTEDAAIAFLASITREQAILLTTGA